MRLRLSQILISFSITMFLMIGFEIVTSSLLPALGWQQYRLTFNVLIILFLALKLDSPVVSWLILILQLVHSVFSIEGWALGTLAALIVVASANYLKDLLQLSSAFMTMVIVQFFQIVWFATVSLIICLKLSDLTKLSMLFWSFIPGSILLSLMAPFVFWILETIWRVPSDSGPSGVEI